MNRAENIKFGIDGISNIISKADASTDWTNIAKQINSVNPNTEKIALYALSSAIDLNALLGAGGFFSKTLPFVGAAVSYRLYQLDREDFEKQIAGDASYDSKTTLSMIGNLSGVVAGISTGLIANKIYSPVIAGVAILSASLSLGIAVYTITHEETLPKEIVDQLNELKAFTDKLPISYVQDDFDLWSTRFFNDQHLDNGIALTGGEALFWGFIKYLDSSLEDSAIFNIIDSMSPRPKQGIESVLTALESIFGFSGGGAVNDELEFFNRLIKLGKSIGVYSEDVKNSTDSDYTIVNLVDMDSSEIEFILERGSGSEKVAVAYASLNLNSFAVVGGSLYQDFDLDLIESQFKGSDYWIDRVSFLKAYLGTNLGDSLFFSDGNESEDTVYVDKSLDVDARTFLYGHSPAYVVFSSEEGGRVDAGVMGDRIYGGVSSDFIITKQGSDFIYAGDGEDVLFANNINNDADGVKDSLFGGKGDDQYYLSAGDVAEDVVGHDVFYVNSIGADSERIVIDDHDGKGKIVINGFTLRIGEYLSSNSWSWSYDDSSIIKRSGSSLVVSFDKGAEVEIKNFSEGDFGIMLLDEPVDEPSFSTSTYIEGDKKPKENEHGGFEYDKWWNIIPKGSEPDRPDKIYDTDSSNTIDSMGGDDVVIKVRGGNDKVNLGDGDDQLTYRNSASGAVIANGGKGRDWVSGGRVINPAAIYI